METRQNDDFGRQHTSFIFEMRKWSLGEPFSWPKTSFRNCNGGQRCMQHKHSFHHLKRNTDWKQRNKSIIDRIRKKKRKVKFAKRIMQFFACCCEVNNLFLLGMNFNLIHYDAMYFFLDYAMAYYNTLHHSPSAIVNVITIISAWTKVKKYKHSSVMLNFTWKLIG